MKIKAVLYCFKEKPMFPRSVTYKNSEIGDWYVKNNSYKKIRFRLGCCMG